jgi:hypothetical protein
MNLDLNIDDDLLTKVVNTTPSFQQSIPAIPTEIVPPISKPAKKRFIIRSWIIDKFTTKRKRIELTPSVCDICAFDVAEAKHGKWDAVPDFKKSDVLLALQEHKREQHPVKEDLIVTEDELATEWLGSNNVF